MRKFGLILATALFPFGLHAQLLSSATAPAPQKTAPAIAEALPQTLEPAPEIPAAKNKADDEAAPKIEYPVSEFTPQQIIVAQKSLKRTLQDKAVHMDVRERRRLMNAIETMQKMRVRQHNLDLQKDENPEVYTQPSVNLHDRKDFQKYLNATFTVDPPEVVSSVEPEQATTAETPLQ